MELSFIWAADTYIGNGIVSQFGLDLWLTNFASTIETDVPVVFFYNLTIGGIVLAITMFPIFYGFAYWGIASWRSHRVKKRAQKEAMRAEKQMPIAPAMTGDAK